MFNKIMFLPKGTLVCSQSGDPHPPSSHATGPTHQTRTRWGLRMSIVQDSSVTVEYIPESKSMAKLYVYEELSTDTVLLASDPAYGNFKNVNANLDPGKLVGVKEILKQKYFLSVQNRQVCYDADSLIRLYLDQIKELDSLDAVDSVLSYSVPRENLIAAINLQQQIISSIMTPVVIADSTIIQNANT